MKAGIGTSTGLVREEATMSTSLVRPRHDKVIAGVCAGLAQHYGWNANTVRLVFVVSCLLPGPQFIVYVAFWLFMPRSSY